jgi:hypothetical protein
MRVSKCDKMYVMDSVRSGGDYQRADKWHEHIQVPFLNFLTRSDSKFSFASCQNSTIEDIFLVAGFSYVVNDLGTFEFFLFAR